MNPSSIRPRSDLRRGSAGTPGGVPGL
jgi:hypothetical protein